ncbi:ribonuclease T2-like [Syngnathoides biaculeatus]|uniref:ribonuclease T2-like n=1 Tax=Syngnathoides biaculeatus TaxID=300417 RepID=UPI002ADD7195|nr:ribonuclease T2-like [Syngnathoides biaculeatus]
MARWLLPPLACACVAALLCGAAAGHDDDGDGDGRTFCSWTCAVFTLQWPGGFCQSLDNISLCTIPEHVNDWMIHGLWPLKAQRCCDCWPVFPSDIQEVRQELERTWPSLLTSRSSFHFWKDEWEKHGACAACAEGLNSPLRYFQTCLKLRQLFDLRKALDAAGIAPSCRRPYKLAQVLDVLLPLVGNKSEIQCVKDRKDREVWFQVKVRLSRNLTVGCDRHGGGDDDDGRDVWGGAPPKGHPCPAQGGFYFFPIDHRHPTQPCG